MYHFDDSVITKNFSSYWNYKHFIHENGLFISIRDSIKGYSLKSLF